MTYETISLEISDNLAVITMNRPDVMNAMNSKMRAEIPHAVKAAEAQARAIVLTGTGRAFCAGQDLSDRSNNLGTSSETTLMDEYEPMIRAISECPLPTISAVNGAAAGAGANLALAADVVIASENAQFLQAFTRIGLIPDAAGTYWLPRNMGFARAMGASLFAEPISARQAADWGMIWEAIPEEDFEAHWRARASKLANGPTLAYTNTKKALRATYQNTAAEQFALEARLQGECSKTHDFAEGVKAFLEKRLAVFKGR
ncbi:MAG: enoyl-CoA hydratase-related protein [Paracoccaceae bacterium]